MRRSNSPRRRRLYDKSTRRRPESCILSAQTVRVAPLALAGVPTLAFAQESPIAPVSLLPMAIALLLVLVIMAVAAWTMKKFAGGRSFDRPEPGLRMVRQLALGGRERLVIVEAGDRWLLLGVTSAAIQRLGTLPRPVSDHAGAPAAAAPVLRELLARIGASQP